jgi:murein DD-endopeptidase MepM/ murein hydrolase activator NlpD
VNGGLHLGQRFAIDFNRLDVLDRLVVGNPDVDESYPTYDQPALAVADATVAEVVDRYPDQVPNHPTPVTLAEGSGNHVVLNLGRGRYAEYAHLKPGSVVVRAGQRVTKGQVLARTGNSGSSSGPHLHFQVMDAPSATRSDGLPYVFESFTLQGRLPPLSDALFARANAGESLPVTGPSGPHRDELPLGGDVVTLP